jgi:hypothetical protein
MNCLRGKDLKKKVKWMVNMSIITIAVAINCFIAFDKFKIIDFENNKKILNAMKR